MKVSLTNLFLKLFIISYLFYVLSSSYLLKEQYIWLYFAKHISIIVIFLIGISFSPKFLRINHLKYIGLSLLIIIPFLVRSGFAGFIVFLQYFVLCFSALVLSRLWTKEICYKILFILFSIAIIPIFIDILMNDAAYIYNSHWGRYRLLLGYWHSKEAGISIVIPLLITRFIMLEKNVKQVFLTIWDMASLILLYFMQSRNTLLFYFNFMILTFVIKKVGFKKMIIFIFVPCFISLIFLVTTYYEEFNILSSYRLEYWGRFDLTEFYGTGTSIGGYEELNELGQMSKFHTDNFYLEYFVENGIFPTIILLLILFLIVKYFGTYKYKGVYVNSIYIPFLVFCFFDAGMFSTGNFLNLFVWSFVIAAGSGKYKEIGKFRTFNIGNNKMKLQHRAYSEGMIQ